MVLVAVGGGIVANVGPQQAAEKQRAEENLVPSPAANAAHCWGSRNRLVEPLRFRVRLAFDLRCLRATGYGFAAEELDAVGRLVGGWRKVAGRFD